MPASLPDRRAATGAAYSRANRVFRAATGGGEGRRGERGLILIVVLVMVVLLALLTAGYSFAVRANLSGVYARRYEYQARIAAEAGIQRAIVQLRKGRDNPNNWYDVPQLFRQAPVERVEGEANFQKSGVGTQVEAKKKDDDKTQPDPTWRFSLYAVNTDNPEQTTVRYGLVPETAKLDLNLATEEQLRTLFAHVIPDAAPNNQQVDRDSLVQCLLDWREKGDTPRPKGAKSEYYRTLKPGYNAKCARFDTVEELLQVKGFNGWILYGEDYNRNGLIDANEDDGNASFPPDNQNGKLERGLAPFLTVVSRELNSDSDGKPRINLNMKELDKLEEQLRAKQIGGNIVEYIMGIRKGGVAFRSVMDLLPVPPPEPEPETQPADSQPADSQPSDEEDDGTTSQPSDESSTSQPGDATSQPSSQPNKRTRNSGAGTGSRRRRGTTQPTSQPKEPPLTNLTDEVPPGTAADLPVLLDRLSADLRPMFSGRINVTTAPREVLLTLPELTEEEVNAIVSARGGLSGDDKRTPAWLLTQGLVSERKFRKLLPKLTSGSATFSVDSVGFADHVGTTKRLSAILEMRGPIGQVLYYRDLTPLGPAYTPHGEETRSVVRESNR